MRDVSLKTFETPVRTTFVLPDRNRSGGVRVTVEMANRLLGHGYPVRIAHRIVTPTLRGRVKGALNGALRLARGQAGNDDWVQHFRGPVEPFARLGQLGFERDEVVIAVGSMTAREVYELDVPGVVKARYCHGFHRFLPERMTEAWAMPMPTLTVAGVLVPELRTYNDEEPIWVVPNGINTDEYFVDAGAGDRDGIGTIFNRNPAKNPEQILEMMARRVPERWPAAKRYVFGAHRRPPELPADAYRSFPPVAEARRLYNRSKVWLLMSQAEGLPGPVLEAMACGAVMVSTDNDGSRELVRHGENGLLFPIGDLEACCAAVDAVLTDDALRARLAAGGLGTAQAYSWDGAVGKMRAVLSELLERAGRTPAAKPSQAPKRELAEVAK